MEAGRCRAISMRDASNLVGNELGHPSPVQLFAFFLGDQSLCALRSDTVPPVKAILREITCRRDLPCNSQLNPTTSILPTKLVGIDLKTPSCFRVFPFQIL